MAVNEMRNLLLAFVLLRWFLSSSGVLLSNGVLHVVVLCLSLPELLVIITRRGWPEIGHQSFQVFQLDCIGDLWLAQHSQNAVNLNAVQLRNADLGTTRQEVIRGHHLHVGFAIELRQVVDDVLSSKRLPHRQVVYHQALGNIVEDRLCNVEHLVFADLDVVHLVLVVLIVVVFILVFLLILVALRLLIGLHRCPLFVLLIHRLELLLILRVAVLTVIVDNLLQFLIFHHCGIFLLSLGSERLFVLLVLVSRRFQVSDVLQVDLHA